RLQLLALPPLRRALGLLSAAPGALRRRQWADRHLHGTRRAPRVPPLPHLRLPDPLVGRGPRQAANGRQRANDATRGAGPDPGGPDRRRGLAAPIRLGAERRQDASVSSSSVTPAAPVAARNKPRLQRKRVTAQGDGSSFSSWRRAPE